MFKKVILILLVILPLSLMAQDDDPFGGGSSGGGNDPFGGGSSGGGGDDPFGAPSTTPDPTPPSTPSTEPFDPNQNTPSTPVDTPATSTDPFGNSGGDNSGASAGDPFGTGGGSDSGDFGAPTGGLASGNNSDALFDNMTDTLTEPLVPNFPWEQKAIKEKPLLSNYEIDESDVFWAKTVYREIDIREKMNHPFAYPRAPFMTVMLDVLNKNPDIVVYKEDTFSGREFSEASSWEKIETTLGNEREEEIFDFDANGNEITTIEKIVDKFRVGKVKRFKIKEVWFFDKKHSRMKVRIMGIAPLMEVTAADFDIDAVLAQQYGLSGAAAQQTLFWVYYPDVREQLARYETFNPLNDALSMSWDDLLSSRYFSSYITKVSNPLDRQIKDYTNNGLNALYESEAIKEDIFNFEHDLWTY